jgi:hypothetical protein
MKDYSTSHWCIAVLVDAVKQQDGDEYRKMNVFVGEITAVGFLTLQI